jgi:hypothetical protein
MDSQDPALRRISHEILGKVGGVLGRIIGLLMGAAFLWGPGVRVLAASGRSQLRPSRRSRAAA